MSSRRPAIPLALEAIRAEALECRRCPLAGGRTQVVFGEGHGASGLLILGEAPGQEEDRDGRPFVGSAGRILDKLLVEAGVARAAAYVTNTVLCHPPEDRDPTADELFVCGPYLDVQIAVVQPRVIITLGLIPLRRLLGQERRVERDHGNVCRYGDARVVPTFHPSALRWRVGRRQAALQDLVLARSLVTRKA